MTDAVGCIRNISGEDRVVPSLGGRLVLANQGGVEVPLAQVTSFTQQESIWAPDDEAAQAEHDAMLEAIAALRADEAPEEPEEPVEHDASARELIASLVDGDKVYAAAVLAQEQARPTPRSTVIKAAEKRINDDTQEG